ncbi:hypothetical protein NP493_40g10014 [Ridgeia piscesae]|uniref:Uncharacterized protein n=1 Tax=Ridgeia piscesae TaxID=27915 RepID=A0AAD9PCI8_RIDPI|nr:hypothetical protein NP493_40g10014 [Ridgeia piscesae]
MVSLLPNPVVNEVAMSLDDSCVSGSGDMSDVCVVSTLYNIQLRNLTCDEVLRILGFDWLLLFLQGHLHRSTVVLAMRTLLLMLGSPSVLARFREGSTCGGWLDETQSVLENRIGIALG